MVLAAGLVFLSVGALFAYGASQKHDPSGYFATIVCSGGFIFMVYGFVLLGKEATSISIDQTEIVVQFNIGPARRLDWSAQGFGVALVKLTPQANSRPELYLSGYGLSSGEPYGNGPDLWVWITQECHAGLIETLREQGLATRAAVDTKNTFRMDKTIFSRSRA